MKSKNIFRIWLWGNLMIGFWMGVFKLFEGELVLDGIVIYFLVIVIGFLFSVPSLIILMIFQNFYQKKNIENNYAPYVWVILLINFLYLLVYYASSPYFKIKEIAFFFLSTFCGMVAFFIEYNKVKKNISKIETEEIQ